MNKDSKAIEKFLKWANDLGFSEAPKEEAPLLTGWICPRCGKVHSPFSTNCDCPPQSFTSTGVSTISTLESSQKEPAEVSEESELNKFTRILDISCIENLTSLTSNERHTIYDAFKIYLSQSLPQSQKTDILHPECIMEKVSEDYKRLYPDLYTKSQKTESAEEIKKIILDKFKEFWVNKDDEYTEKDQVDITLGEKSMLKICMEYFAQSHQVSQEARPTDQDYKAKYEKCIKIIKRLDAGIIGMYDL